MTWRFRVATVGGDFNSWVRVYTGEIIAEYVLLAMIAWVFAVSCPTHIIITIGQTLKAAEKNRTLMSLFAFVVMNRLHSAHGKDLRRIHTHWICHGL